MKVMLVDDEPGIRLFVKTVVEEAGHEYCFCDNSVEALQIFKQESPDVVILDVMMPKIDGFEVCRQIRSVDSTVPVLFLSAKGDIIDKRIGFSNGGDDYLVKPCNEEELLIRLEALNRRAKKSGIALLRAQQSFTVGDFEFDIPRHQVYRKGQKVVLTPKEYQLLLLLASHHGTVMSKEELIESIWGREFLDDAISIAVYVRKIREKIEDNAAKPRHLKTNWGVGYVFEA